MIFAEFLQDIHQDEYSGSKTYEDWVNHLPATEWIGLADKFIDLEREFISVNDLTDI